MKVVSRFARHGLVAASCLALVASLAAVGVSGAGAASGSPRSQTLAARAASKLAEMPPTKIGITTPLNRTPPRGKTVVFLQCSDVPQCAQFQPGIRQGTTALGWNLKVISFVTSNPSSMTAAFQAALQYKPVAVTFTGMGQSVWQSEVPIYRKAGVAIMPMVGGPVRLSPSVPTNIFGPANISAAGKILGNWFIGDSNARGSALFVDVPLFAVLAEYTSGFVKQVAARCTKCAVATLNVPLSEVVSNSVVPAVVAYVQAHPSVNYVMTSDGAFLTGLHSALATIGRSNIKIGVGTPGLADEQGLINHTEQAATGQAFRYTGMLFVDAAARYLEHMKILPEDGTEPQMLLTAANVRAPSNDLLYPRNYQAQFRTLWKVK